MSFDTRPVVKAVEAAAVRSSTVDRAELLEAVLYAVYDHVKFRVPGGTDSEERDDLGRLLNAVIAHADRARRQTQPPPLTPAQGLIDDVLDQACQNRPSSRWVITAPLEVVVALPRDEGWVVRNLPLPPGRAPYERTYRGAGVDTAEWDKPLVVFTDVATDTSPLYLNLETGQVGSSVEVVRSP